MSEESSAMEESPEEQAETSEGIAAIGPLSQEEEAALDDEILEEREQLEVDESRGGQRQVSVIFASIAGFETEPTMSQDEIEEVAIRKNSFDSALNDTIVKYGGVIDKIIRGFFMATFGTTTQTKEDPVLAVLAAMEMTEIADNFDAEVHVGVNSGKAWVGQIRTERTIDTTVIGDTVNLAARLKTQAGHNQVVCSPATYELTKDYFVYEVLRELPPGTLKGIDRPMTVYTPIERGEKAKLVESIRAQDADRLAALEEELIPEYLKEKIRAGSSRLQGERKMVTLLYSDVSGFTALSEKFASQPELIAEVMNRCHKRLGDIVYKYEGVVDKLVGDEIMAIFGAPIMHEDDPERAIWCALEMQEEMEKLSEEVQRELNVPPLSVHIGINTGRVSIGNLIPGTARMDYTVIGEPTELAEQLEDISEGGEIIVGQRTYRLTRALFEFEERPPVKIGDREVPVYLVLGKKEQAESKRGLAEMGDVPMIGRDRQFQQAMGLVDRLFAGESPITTVIGEAGFGKSRLKRETRKVVEERGGLWIEGACFSNTEKESYSVFLRAFEEYFDLRDDDTPAARRSKLREKLEEVFEGNEEAIEEVMPYIGNMLSIPFEGALAEKIAYLDPEQLQRRTFVAVRDLFLREAERQPLVVALDDLHWLDNVSNELIYFLLDNIQNVPVLFFNIYRPERRDLCWAIGETAAERYPDRYELIEIEPLDPDSARELLDRLLPMNKGEAEETLKARLLEKAGGNPFYLEEFIRVLLDDEFIEREGDIWVLKRDIEDFQVPDSLEQMLSARIDKLDDASKDVLQSASVVGRKFEHEILEDAVEDTSDLDDCLEHLMDLDFVDEVSPDPLAYAFEHIVTYEISYNAIVVGRRRELHRRVGHSYERRHEGDLDRFLELLAFHYSESTDKHKAIHYLAKAGSKARRSFNNLDAVSFYERALEFVDQVEDPDREDVLEVLDGLADVYAVLGRYESAIESAERALEMTREEPFRSAIFYRKIGDAYTKWGEWDQAEGPFDNALEMLTAVEPGPEREIESARVHDKKGFLAYSRSDFPSANEECQTALRLIEGIDALDVLCSVYKNLGNINLRLGKLDEAMNYYTQGIEIAERIGDNLLQSQLYNNLSVANRLLARMEDAIASIRRSIELKEQMAYADGLSASYSTLGYLLRVTGDNEAALENLNKALDIAKQIGAPQRIAEAELALGSYYYWLEDYDAYIEHNFRALEICREMGHREREVQALMNICDGYLKMGDDKLEEAERYSREAEALAREIGLIEGIIAATKNIGVVYWRRREYDKAIEAFENALETAQEAKIMTSQAEIYRNIGDVHLDRGDTEKAREALSKALDLYTQLKDETQIKLIQERIPAA